MVCKFCGSNTFTAHQLVRMDIMVDSQNHFIGNINKNIAVDIYDSETPYGPYTCCGCGAEYNELSEEEKPLSGPVEGWKSIV